MNRAERLWNSAVRTFDRVSGRAERNEKLVDEQYEQLRKEALAAHQANFSYRGNPIEVQQSSPWRIEGFGLYELKLHVGKSSEGFHGGLEVSKEGGDSSLRWSSPRATEEAAWRAAHRLETAWNLQMNPTFERMEARMIAAAERSVAPARNQAKGQSKDEGTGFGFGM
jgi:hypothetical protein